MGTHIDYAELVVSPSEFFQVGEPERIKSSIGLRLSDHSYLPKADEPRADWVASVAVPAFKTLARMGVLAPRFCTIGTGAGLDALAAVEILQARSVGFTDLHEDVLAHARENIQSNLLDQDVELIGGAGDILSPLAGKVSQVDVIYENLPNIPMAGSGDLADGQTSSTFIAERVEEIAGFAEKNLVTLHYLALQQAHPVLRVGGRVLSSIGARIPLSEILSLAGAAGYNGSILTYTWKIQSEPHEVVGGYAQWEKEGMGPFHFYPVSVLRDAFAGMSPAAAGAQALQMEKELSPYEISAVDALALVEKGQKVGHTVAILDSVKIPDSAL
ncbi:class I SAM-dependent methyltransferase [Streptomyces sp. NPDC090052]|uniref:class I SAM-dependent methyltransferase n=1 Tax=unclassified Streptomyces TaxID=2593676 RepID=UPI00225AA860|nr:MULTISPECIES: class I SAM-dependent methyltransferase [unclassified Streptomyces]WSV08513.1 class I SAM-dependent methyltransferase [Streptomyces sp. NBC_01020]WSX46592.1 class I SAM-dependent methyltransferase [Streptomyces sp. NBC_00963]WSX65326.1 class I SAM-dependent methyltransferase [Streptomyces sp. NBC_00932]MCX4728676.1 class I SAM-dependent methyltransferase [Streptomyces sp. NBC_01306]MCX4729167.1 class I SAM-dependent methyltransferase [Streptomyces sp. NBC_01306]